MDIAAINSKLDANGDYNGDHNIAHMPYALLEEVAGLLAVIESTPGLPYAHLAPRAALLATRELETELVSEETASEDTLKAITSCEQLQRCNCIW